MMTKTHNQNVEKNVVVGAGSVGTSLTQPVPLRPREQHRSGGKKTLRARGLGDLLLNCIPRNFKTVASIA